ncbi:MAG: FkbM family methyltransferase [Anaerolineae bacterium]|nr:FkbM family methyltransferase [Anaerolineae bacterium]MDK1118443.1 FkbM family methyltransferase [Anaerolineae bacterium]
MYTEIFKPKPLKALVNAILLRVIPETIRYGPATLHLDMNDPVVSGALALRVFEPSELAFFQRYCRGDMTMVDIGANVGLYSVLSMHQLDSSGRIVAFEPHPITFSILQKNIETNQAGEDVGPHVDVYNMAAAPERGMLELRLNPENRGDNRLYQGTYQGKIENWETTPVKSIPIDSIFDELGIDEVNFVKIDIQGYELQALTGFKETLTRSKNVILMSEFWPKGLREAGDSGRKYLQALVDLGFQLYELKERPRGKVEPLKNWDQLNLRLQDRKYANIIGVKGYPHIFETN